MRKLCNLNCPSITEEKNFLWHLWKVLSFNDIFSLKAASSVEIIKSCYIWIKLMVEWIFWLIHLMETLLCLSYSSCKIYRADNAECSGSKWLCSLRPKTVWNGPKLRLTDPLWKKTGLIWGWFSVRGWIDFLFWPKWFLVGLKWFFEGLKWFLLGST